MFWLFIKAMFYKEQIAELFIDLATSGTILDVAFLLLKFSLIVWVKSGNNPLLKFRVVLFEEAHKLQRIRHALSSITHFASDSTVAETTTEEK
jgi:hypothetical protein